MKILIPEKSWNGASVADHPRRGTHPFKCTLLVMLLAFSAVTAFAQRQVSGKVTGAKDKAPLPGVTILVKGTTNGTITDASGAYVLQVPQEQSTLVFSFLGFLTQEVAVG